jgi:hypothetical protein
MMFVNRYSILGFPKALKVSSSSRVLAMSSKENDFSFMFLMDFWIICTGLCFHLSLVLPLLVWKVYSSFCRGLLHGDSAVNGFRKGLGIGR